MNAKTAIIAATAVALLAPFVSAALTDGSSNAANKTAANGSTIQSLSADVIDNDAGLAVLSTSIKTSKPTDLLLQLTMECALWTEVISTTIQNHPAGYEPYSRAEAHVVAWVEVDGVAVKVASGDDGKVVFCDRVHEQELSDIDNSTGNHTIRQYLETRNANAFNWIVLNAGSGVHTIVVKVDIQASNTEGAFAEGAVGKRTLIVEPTRFANGATIY
ncbi:MAG: hypothetical protein AABY18_02320 [Candidatus Thermoplasmatota archaeon]